MNDMPKFRLRYNYTSQNQLLKEIISLYLNSTNFCMHITTPFLITWSHVIFAFRRGCSLEEPFDIFTLYHTVSCPESPSESYSTIQNHAL